MSKTKTKKVSKKKVARQRYFGVTKIKSGAKLCWLSEQNKNGWSLGLALDKRTVWLRNIRLASVGDVEKTLKSKVVFIHLKG